MLSKTLLASLVAREPSEVAPALEALKPEDWPSLVQLSRLHRCTPLLRAQLRRLGWLSRLPEPVQQYLQQVTQLTATDNLRRFHELSQLMQQLGEATPLIVLKGGCLARTHYEDISLRMMVDIDVLARPDDLPRVEAALQAIGFEQHQHQPDDEYEDCQHLPPFAKGRSSIELHRTLLHGDSPYVIDEDALWARSTAAATPGLRYLSREDQLLHLCVHAGQHHAFATGLYALIDIARLSSDPALDWPLFTRIVRDSHADRCVYLMLRLAQEDAAAQIPAAALAALCPAGYTSAHLAAVRAAMLESFTLQGDTSFQFANVLAGLVSMHYWRRLPHIIERRFLRKADDRKRWSATTGTSWRDQLQPLLIGLRALFGSRDNWRQVLARRHGHRLTEWVSRPVAPSQR
jgi:Uncharacterised nucleotidyltransferase